MTTANNGGPAFPAWPPTDNESLELVDPLITQRNADARDAARYRWLRSRDLETIMQGGVFAGMTPDNVILNGEDLDNEVDSAIAVHVAMGDR